MTPLPDSFAVMDRIALIIVMAVLMLIGSTFIAILLKVVFDAVRDIKTIPSKKDPDPHDFG